LVDEMTEMSDEVEGGSPGDDCFGNSSPQERNRPITNCATLTTTGKNGINVGEKRPITYSRFQNTNSQKIIVQNANGNQK